MLIKRPRGWELAESAATSEALFHDRRRLIKAIAAGPILLGAAPMATAGMVGEALAAAAPADPSAPLYPFMRNLRYRLDRPLSEEKLVTTYNNFYEFGSQKNIWRNAQKLPIRPWTVTLDGMVEKERTIDFDMLLKQMPKEERLYRHRCVEAWSMAVPWSGCALRALVEFARPLSSAKYVAMETFHDKNVASGQKAFWYPWPYREGLTIAEATNELAFIATGIYGKPMPKQNGSPLRLAVPWKYGFKSIKSIVRFHFTDKRPATFWQTTQGREYGFWANVNPDVPHPRWSQARERPLGAKRKVKTLLYNGYGEFVADLYKDMKGEALFM